MRKHYAFVVLLLLLFSKTYSQYTTVYENSFRNWAPGQGWVMIDNDSLSRKVGFAGKGVTLGIPTPRYEMIDNLLGLHNTANWVREPYSVPGKCYKIMISPPLALGADPYTYFYSRVKTSSGMEVWVIANPNDTTLNGFTAKLLNCVTEGYNVTSLANWANTTIRLAFRLRGHDMYGLIDNFTVVNKTTGLVTIPDSCFRAYLRTVVTSAFVGEKLDFLSPVVLNTTELRSPNGCIRSLEGLQYFPFVKFVDFSNNRIEYMPPNQLYYADTVKLSNNLLTYVPGCPMATGLHLDNNLLEKIPNMFNQWANQLYIRNNLLYDCLPGTNRFVYGDLRGNIGVRISHTYYDLEYDYNAGPTDCRYGTGNVHGTVYFDVNQDGVFDDADVTVAGQQINFLQGAYIYSHNAGNYGLYADTGKIDLAVTNLGSNFTCTNPLSTHLDEDEVIKHDFRIVANSPVTDLGVVLTTPFNAIDTGGFIRLQISVCNNGTNNQTGTVKMYIPPAYASITVPKGNVVNDTLVWSFVIKPFETVSNIITYRNNYQSAQNLQFMAKVISIGDTRPVNDTSSVPITITVGTGQNGRPFDPNNKIVSTPQVTPGFNGYLNYTINFENIGTGNASRVVVRDYLSHKFDYSSLEILGGTHPFVVNWGYDSVLQFTFYPIELTPKSIDSTRSHGTIWYRIKPKQAILAEQTIGNYAAIYFDTEAPVNTDTALVWAGQLHADFSVAKTVQCGAASISYTDISPGTRKKNTWVFEGGTPSTSTVARPNVRYTASGTYKVTQIVNAREYTDTLVRSVNIVVDTLPPSKIVAVKTTPICNGDSVLVSIVNPLPGYKYRWRNGDSTSTSIYNKQNYVYVTTTAPSGCAASSNSINFTIISLTPVITDTLPCRASTYLNVNSNFSTYLWSTGATTRGIPVNQYATYMVQVTDTNGCIGRDTFNFAQHTAPVVTITGDTLACANVGTVLGTTQPFVSYKWGHSSTTAAAVTVSTTATYFLTVSDENGCTATGKFSFKATPVTYPIISASKTMCKGDTATLTVSAGFAGYTWSTGDTMQTTTVSAGGTYEVSAVGASGCVTTSSYNITEQDKYKLWVDAVNTGSCPGQSIQLIAKYDSNPVLTASSAGCTSQTATVGAGTTPESGNYGVFSNYAKSTRSQLLYTAAELQAALGGPKLITQISFQMATVNSTVPLENFAVKMGYTKATALTGGWRWQEDMVDVYPSSTFQPVIGWNNLILRTPIYWDGTSNLVVEICRYNPTASNNTATTAVCTNQPVVSNVMSSNNGGNICGVDASYSSLTLRPNIRFDYCTPTTAPVPVYPVQFNWYAVGNAVIDSPGVPNTKATASSTTKFILTMSDSRGCQDADSVWSLGGLVSTVTITASGNVLHTTDVGTYQWYRDNVAINGATSATYTADVPGAYSLMVTDANGCESVSNTIYMTITDIENTVTTIQPQIKVYPNPSSGIFNININQQGLSRVMIQVNNLVGQQLYSLQDNSLSNQYMRQLDLNMLADGVYFVSIEAGDQCVVQKIVKGK